MISFEDLQDKKKKIAVVGLGYVGLPLALALAEHFKIIGFDISQRRVAELKSGIDRTLESECGELKRSQAEFSCDPAVLRQAAVIIVAVPTPIDQSRRPELTPITGASKTVGENLSPGSVVVYESTVYPGLTEDICVPILEKASGLRCGEDFKVGYSPERINPGDKVHTLESIVKIVAGMDEPTLDLLARVYGSVVKAGVHRASSIKVAEAAKVIENTQRDLNIALMNELSQIFERLGIDTLEVLEAAGTKWNFLPFRPGLVGGHCIGVDPYYLTFKAQEMGLHPQVILAGRRINDAMGARVAEETVKMLVCSGVLVNQARIGVLGLTFKENVPDLRNSKVADILSELKQYCPNILVHDPLADPEEAKQEYGVELLALDKLSDLSALILAVPHDCFKELGLAGLKTHFKSGPRPLLVDVRGLFAREAAKQAGFDYWRL